MPSPGHPAAARFPAELRLLAANGGPVARKAGTLGNGDLRRGGGRRAGDPYRPGTATGPRRGGRAAMPGRGRPTMAVPLIFAACAAAPGPSGMLRRLEEAGQIGEMGTLLAERIDEFAEPNLERGRETGVGRGKLGMNW